MDEVILIIDDEMHLQGSTDKRYRHLSEKDLAIQIKTLLESQNFQVQFAQSGEKGLLIIKNDADHKIKLVLLDIVFNKVVTKMQGPEIFRRIRELRGDLPIIVITIMPTRKLPGEEDIFREFVELGASLYLEKKNFNRMRQEYINFINSVARKENLFYTLKWHEGIDSYNKTIIDIDIFAKGNKGIEYSILKNPYRFHFPMSEYIKKCIEKFPDYVHWTDCEATRKNMLDIEFHKAVHKINDAVLRSSGGRIPALIERGGRVGCRLNIQKIREF